MNPVFVKLPAATNVGLSFRRISKIWLKCARKATRAASRKTWIIKIIYSDSLDGLVVRVVTCFAGQNDLGSILPI